MQIYSALLDCIISSAEHPLLILKSAGTVGLERLLTLMKKGGHLSNFNMFVKIIENNLSARLISLPRVLRTHSATNSNKPLLLWQLLIGYTRLLSMIVPTENNISEKDSSKAKHKKIKKQKKDSKRGGRNRLAILWGSAFERFANSLRQAAQVSFLSLFCFVSRLIINCIEHGTFK